MYSQNLVLEEDWWDVHWYFIFDMEKDEVRNQLYISGIIDYLGPIQPDQVFLDKTGKAMNSYPNINGKIGTSVPDENGGWFIGGEFDKVGDSLRANLAHINNLGQVSAWNPTSDLAISKMAISGSKIFIYGSFTTINGQARDKLAALDKNTGALLAWNPQAPNKFIADMSALHNKVFIGGLFDSIGSQERKYLAAYNATTGQLTNWNPEPDDRRINFVYGVDANVYVGGYFDTISGIARSNIAALDTINGALRNWNPSLNRVPRSIHKIGKTIYVGGDFSTINGDSRKYLGAIDSATGITTAWKPDSIEGPFGRIRSMTSIDSILYLAGHFDTIAGIERNNLAAFNLNTGALESWNPSAVGISAGSIRGVVKSYDRILTHGPFASIGGVKRFGLASIDISTGKATSWQPIFSEDANALTINDIEINNDILYVAGLFDKIDNQKRKNLASFDLKTGQLTSWNPKVNGRIRSLAVTDSLVYVGGDFDSVANTSRKFLAAIDKQTGALSAWNPNPNKSVIEIKESGNQMIVGGEFSLIGGVARSAIAAIDKSNAAVSNWNPKVTGTVYVITIEDSSVYIGGKFTQVNGKTRHNIAEVDLISGNASNWSPSVSPNATLNYFVRSMSVVDSMIYISGWFDTVAGVRRTGAAAIHRTTGVPTSWTHGLGEYNPSLLACDSFVYVSNPLSAYRIKNLSTGVDINLNQQSENAIAIYPNPFEDQLFIQLEDIYEECQLRIIDMTGKVILEKRYTQTSSIIMDFELSNGIYVIELSKNKLEKTAFKIVKE